MSTSTLTLSVTVNGRNTVSTLSTLRARAYAERVIQAARRQGLTNARITVTRGREPQAQWSATHGWQSAQVS